MTSQEYTYSMYPGFRYSRLYRRLSGWHETAEWYLLTIFSMAMSIVLWDVIPFTVFHPCAARFSVLLHEVSLYPNAVPKAVEL